MDFKESERYYHGYIFLPCCTKECYQNQPHKLQEYRSLYPSLIPKNEAFLPDRANSVDQVPHPLRFSAYREGGYRFIFPSTQKGQTQSCEISHHNGIDAEGPLRTSYKAGKYISPNQGRIILARAGKRSLWLVEELFEHASLQMVQLHFLTHFVSKCRGPFLSFKGFILHVLHC